MLRPQGRWGSHPSTPVGAIAPNPKFDVVGIFSVCLSCLRCAKKLATDEVSIVVYEAFKLARTTSPDASASRNGGMTVLLFVCRSRSLRGSGQRPDGGVVRGRRRPLTAGHGVAQTPTNILFATMPPLCQKAGNGRRKDCRL